MSQHACRGDGFLVWGQERQGNADMHRDETRLERSLNTLQSELEAAELDYRNRRLGKVLDRTGKSRPKGEVMRVFSAQAEIMASHCDELESIQRQVRSGRN